MLRRTFRLIGACCFVSAWLRAATFSGSVADSLTRKPIPGAIVTVGTQVSRTDANGHFQMNAQGVNAQGTTVMARAYGYSRSQLVAKAGTTNQHNSNQLDSNYVELKLTPVTPHAVYLSFWGVGTPSLRDAVLHLPATTPVNAVVIDIKGDLGYVCFRSGSAMAAEIGAQKITTVSDMPALLDRLHKQGLYVIGRIVTFKDNVLGTARPNLAVHQNGRIFKDKEGLIWCDPFLSEVRAYNIGLAIEAAKAGFDEIQFDYVRFPDAKGVEFSQPTTEVSRPRAITSFLTEAHERLIPYNVFLAADVFGYICWNKGDTGIGQKIDELGAVLDYISPMLYPSGFTYGIPNYRVPVAHPYEIVRLSLDRARERTKLDPVRFRPWLQSFADYAFDKRQFGEQEIQAQIEAAQSFGADGWLLWNPRNVYSAEALRAASHQLASRQRVEHTQVVGVGSK